METNIEINGVYRLFYNEDNPNNNIFEVRGVVDDVIVCRSLLGRTFTHNIYSFNEGYITPISKDEKVGIVVWGDDENRQNMVVSFNDIKNNPDILNDPWVEIFYPESLRNWDGVETRQIGKKYEYFCPIRNNWYKY